MGLGGSCELDGRARAALPSKESRVSLGWILAAGIAVTLSSHVGAPGLDQGLFRAKAWEAGGGLSEAPVSAPSTLPHSLLSAFMAFLPLKLKKKVEICRHLNDHSRHCVEHLEIAEFTFPLHAYLVGQARSLLDFENANP